MYCTLYNTQYNTQCTWEQYMGHARGIKWNHNVNQILLSLADKRHFGALSSSSVCPIQIWIQTEEKKVWIWVIFGQDYLLMWSQKLDLIASWVPPTCDIFIYLLFLCFRWKHPKYSFCFILRTRMDWCLVWKKYNRESVKKICPEIWVVLPPFFFTHVFAPPPHPQIFSIHAATPHTPTLPTWTEANLGGDRQEINKPWFIDH